MTALLHQVTAVEAELQATATDDSQRGTQKRRAIAGRALCLQLEGEVDTAGIVRSLRECIDRPPNSNQAHALLDHLEESLQAERAAGFLAIEAMEAANPPPGGPAMREWVGFNRACAIGRAGARLRNRRMNERPTRLAAEQAAAGRMTTPKSAATHSEAWAALCDCGARISSQLDALAAVLGPMPDSAPALVLLDRIESDLDQYAALVDTCTAVQGRAA